MVGHKICFYGATWIFLSMKTYVVTLIRTVLMIKTVLMMGPKICFYGATWIFLSMKTYVVTPHQNSLYDQDGSYDGS